MGSGPPKDAPGREPWDYDAFIRHYNTFARERTGWVYDQSSPSAEKLRGWYESSALWDSLLDFAETRYQLDQQV
ncbi:MAG: hypothetical protein ABI888_05390 [Chloroflexota bacterium]